MPAAARRKSRTYSSTDTTPDNRQAATTEQAPWDGSQTRQASWFNAMLKEAEADFDFHQLYTFATVALSKSGAIAVFSPEHVCALEHAQRAGTRGPCARPTLTLAKTYSSTTANQGNIRDCVANANRRTRWSSHTAIRTDS